MIKDNYLFQSIRNTEFSEKLRSILSKCPNWYRTDPIFANRKKSTLVSTNM